MKNSKNTQTEKIIVAFHIGRGGRFHNAGHKSFVGEKNINEFTYNLFVAFENIHEVSIRIKNNSILSRNEEHIFNLINDNNFSELSKFGITEKDLGKKIYVDNNGNAVGLDVENDGTGCMDEDGQYDTTYCCFLEDLSEGEIDLIINSNEYKSTELTAFLEETSITLCQKK